MVYERRYKWPSYKMNKGRPPWRELAAGAEDRLQAASC